MQLGDLKIVAIILLVAALAEHGLDVLIQIHAVDASIGLQGVDLVVDRGLVVVAQGEACLDGLVIDGVGIHSRGLGAVRQEIGPGVILVAAGIALLVERGARVDAEQGDVAAVGAVDRIQCAAIEIVEFCRGDLMIADRHNGRIAPGCLHAEDDAENDHGDQNDDNGKDPALRELLLGLLCLLRSGLLRLYHALFALAGCTHSLFTSHSWESRGARPGK